MIPREEKELQRSIEKQKVFKSATYLYCSTRFLASRSSLVATTDDLGSVTQKKYFSLPEKVLWSHLGLVRSILCISWTRDNLLLTTTDL